MSAASDEARALRAEQLILTEQVATQAAAQTRYADTMRQRVAAAEAERDRWLRAAFDLQDERDRLRELVERLETQHVDWIGPNGDTVHPDWCRECRVDQLRTENGNLHAAMEDARRAVDLANRAGETEQDRAVERAFIRRARPGHVKTTPWPIWHGTADGYSLNCHCGWRGPLSASEQAAHDEFDRHAAGKGEQFRYDRDHLVDVLVHHAQTRTSGCFCGEMRLGESYPDHIADVYEQVAVAGGETGDKQ